MLLKYLLCKNKNNYVCFVLKKKSFLHTSRGIEVRRYRTGTPVHIFFLVLPVCVNISFPFSIFLNNIYSKVVQLYLAHYLLTWLLLSTDQSHVVTDRRWSELLRRQQTFLAKAYDTFQYFYTFCLTNLVLHRATVL